MTETPWTSKEPQPGDLDAELDALDPRHIEHLPGNANVTVRIIVDLDGEDAERLERVSAQRGQEPREVISGLLRGADRPAA